MSSGKQNKFLGVQSIFTRIGHFSKTADITAPKQKDVRFILSFYSSWDI